jgi:predicted RNA-binding Zn-ribbon protein involved in translation (DUF1610 family)
VKYTYGQWRQLDECLSCGRLDTSITAYCGPCPKCGEKRWKETTARIVNVVRMERGRFWWWPRKVTETHWQKLADFKEAQGR